MSLYSDRLAATKLEFPFERWAKSGIQAYSAEACAPFVRIFDELIAELTAIGETASEEQKLACFKKAVIALNDLDERTGLIETGEREDLCELCNQIAAAAGLNPELYGDGEGPASEWRDW